MDLSQHCVSCQRRDFAWYPPLKVSQDGQAAVGVGSAHSITASNKIRVATASFNSLCFVPGCLHISGCETPADASMLGGKIHSTLPHQPTVHDGLCSGVQQGYASLHAAAASWLLQPHIPAQQLEEVSQMASFVQS